MEQDTSWYAETESDFEIQKAEQLIGFAKLVNSGTKFLNRTINLKANIILNDTASWMNWANNPPANTWTPIGTATNKFDGTFDGNGFIISGVYINMVCDFQGFFGVVNNKATIKNLGIIASYIKGKNHVGGFVGDNNGEISNCYSVGIVTGEENVGGFVGYNANNINNSYSVGTVIGTGNEVRGFAGYNYGDMIENCNSIGTVNGKNNIS